MESGNNHGADPRNVRIPSLTDGEAKVVKGLALSAWGAVWGRALTEATRALPEADARQVAYELRLAVTRLAMDGLDPPSPVDPTADADEFDEDTHPGFARGTPTGHRIPGVVNMAEILAPPCEIVLSRPPRPLDPWCDRCRKPVPPGMPTAVMDGDVVCTDCRDKEWGR